MATIKFLVADCGHIIRADNLGGKHPADVSKRYFNLKLIFGN